MMGRRRLVGVRGDRHTTSAVGKQRADRKFYSNKDVQGPSQDLQPLAKILLLKDSQPFVPLEEPSIHTHNISHLHIVTIEESNDLKIHNRF